MSPTFTLGISSTGVTVEDSPPSRSTLNELSSSIRCLRWSGGRLMSPRWCPPPTKWLDPFFDSSYNGLVPVTDTPPSPSGSRGGAGSFGVNGFIS